MRVQRSVLCALVALASAAPAAFAHARYELHLLDVDAATDTAVVRSDTHEYTPLAFAPTGDALTIVRSGGGHDQIQRLSLTDNARAVLSPQRLPAGSAPLPPTSAHDRLASPAPIMRGRKVTYHVWIGRLDGHVITWLARHYPFEPNVAWSHDGQRLVVVGPRSLTRWSVDMYTRGGRLLHSVMLPHTRFLQSPELAPDGSRLLVDRWPIGHGASSRAAEVDLRSGHVSVLRPALDAREPLSRAAWSPSGQTIVALRDPGLRIELFDGVSLARTATLTPSQQLYGTGEWSPDSRRALFIELGDRGQGLAMVDLATPVPSVREIVPISRGSIEAAIWAPDSNTIAYDRSR